MARCMLGACRIRSPQLRPSRANIACHPQDRPTPNHEKLLIAFLFAALTLSAIFAQQVDSSFYDGMKWRTIGPFRAERVSAVAGQRGQRSDACNDLGVP